MITLMTTLALASPGPNNLMVFTLASQRGAIAALPAILGVQIGGLVLIALCSLGITRLLLERPALQATAQTIGLLYLVVIGFTLSIKTPGAARKSDRSHMIGQAPFITLLAFQLLNPKAWLLMTTLASVISANYTGITAFYWQSLIFLFASGITLGLWLGAGNTLHRKLNNKLMQPVFPRVMGIAVVVGATYLLIRKWML